MKEKELSIQSSIMWNSVGSLFYLGCQWLLTVLVVRLSGVEDAGILSLAMSVCNIWYCIAIYGMRNFQVSDTNGKYSDGTYIWSRIITSVIALAGCVIYTCSISYSYVQKGCILLYCLYKISEAFADVYAGVFQKKWRWDYVGVSCIIRGILTLVVFVILLTITGNLLLTLGCMAVSCLAAVVIYDIRLGKTKFQISMVYKKEDVRRLLAECLPLVIYTLLATALATIPRLIMERTMGGYLLGIYGAVATPTLIVQMGATYIFNPFITVFAECYNRGEKTKFYQTLKKCLIAISCLAAVALIGGKIFGKLGLLILYGKEVAAHEELLLPLIGCTILTAFSWLLCGILTVIREFRGLILGNLLGIIVSVLLSFWGIERMGMQGASFALALATLMEILVLCLYMKGQLKRQFSGKREENG